MREIEIQVPSRDAEVVRHLTEEHGDRTPTVLAVERGGDPGWRLVRAQLQNDRVGKLLDAVASRVEGVQFALDPGGMLSIRPPLGDLSEHVADVSRRSTMELVLDALQSIGSWKGMLLYAFVSGLVAAYGVIFDVPYLLTASMLIAPMGAPAMVAVIGVTLGDIMMVRKGAIRFFAALAMATMAAVALGILYGLETPTSTMEEISNLSRWAILLAVAGGAAGAQALVRSERDSLVTATATGFLVAVALSPPSAVLGLSLAMDRGQYAMITSFNLILTFFGIVLGGWLSLRYFGVTTGDASGGRGGRAGSTVLVLATVIGIGGLVAWQPAPEFQKSDLTRDALRVTREAVAEDIDFRLLDSRAHFVREKADWLDDEGLLVRTVVRSTGPETDEEAGTEALRRQIVAALRRTLSGVEPFVDVVQVPAAPEG